MTTELKIPPVGESITEVQIAKWLKAEGDTIKKDEPLAVIDSEKATFELPAPDNGKLLKIIHPAGDTVNVGDVVAQLESGSAPEKPAEAKPEPAAKPPAEPAAPAEKPKPAASKKAAKAPAVSEKPAPAKPPAEEPKPETEAKEPVASKEPAESQEPGEEVPDEAPKPVPKVEAKSPVAKPAPAAKPADGREEDIVPMTMLRRTVARRLVEANQAMAMLTTFAEVDMSATQALRKEHQESFEKRYQVKLGFMSFFVKAAIDALKQFPQLNAEVRDQNIVYRNYFDLGVAISTPRGLVVPVVRNAERLSFAEVEKAIGEFSLRAKDGKLKPEELEGGTFTITNGGVFGSLLSTPIINPPQTGILGMHAIQDRPIAMAGQVVIRPMMYLALTYDHRIVDGREAVLFLRRIKEVIETPARLLLEV
jgi:2-oxoglutarate dehydrogenase E2 component (dihydrolipoamide succinyltransferase)